MRSVLLLALLMIPGASADAATLHRHAAHHHVVLSKGARSSFAAVPGAVDAPSPQPFHYDDAPSYRDPSKFGGPSALPTH